MGVRGGVPTIARGETAIIAPDGTDFTEIIEDAVEVVIIAGAARLAVGTDAQKNFGIGRENEGLGRDLARFDRRM